MKRQYMIILFLLIGYSLQSQVLIALLLGDKLNTGKIEFGIDVGYNYAYISNMDSNKWLRKGNIGFYFDFKMKKEPWYIHTGVLVKSTLGLKDLTNEDLQFLNATTYDAEGDYSQRMSYFIVPVLARYKFKNNIHAEIGPQFGLMRKAWIEFDSDIDGNTAVIKENNTDMINRIDMGMAAGLGYRLLKGLGWTIGVEYYYGFINVYKDKPGTKNSSLFLKLNLPIGASAEKKKQIKELKSELKEKKMKKKEAKKEKKKQEKEQNKS